MPIVQLTLKSLADLDSGRPAAAFLHEMTRAAQDCQDRPGDKNAREVTLVLKLTPVPVTNDGITECEEVDIQMHIKSKVPTRKTKAYSAKVNRKGQLSFSSNSPENVNQTTFSDINPETGKVER